MTDTKMFLLGVITFMVVTTSLADKQNAWNLKFSDPNRGGKFLNIPIHYGDWVPITAAKALVEEVANRQRQQAPRERVDKNPVKEEAKPEESDRRADHGGVHYVDTHNKNRGYQTNFRHHQPQQQQQQRHHVQHHNTNTRRQDQSKSIRFSGQNHLSADASRRNTKKLPPPPPTHFNQIGNNVRTKPVAPPQPQQQSAFPFGFNSFSSFNPFSFFDTGRPSVTTPAPRAPGVVPVTQDKTVTNVNAIRTIAAPDLSKYGPGPPVIELDSGKDGEIILGRPYHVGDGQRDHLAGFVSVDFDGFTPGDREDKKAKLKKKQKQQEKEKLAIIVGGKSNAKPRDESDLVNFLNNDKENTETFVFSSDKNPPQGFAKIDLPFMDPTKHHGHLPKAFIAPKGIPIPDGYKGKPLPTQPSVAAVPVTTEKVLVHSTQDSHNLFRARPSRFQPVSSEKVTTQAKPVSSTEKPASLFTSSLLRSKTRNRPSLDDLFRKNIQKAALLDEKNKNSRERTEAYDRTYKINNKVEDARKEFQKESTLSPVIIPVENNFNTFKLVTDNNHEEVAESHNDVIDLDHVISAGEDANDPISLVFEPEEVLIQSTFEQEKQKEEVESTSVETSTSFAPTVVPTTFAETTTPTTVAETTTEEATSSTTTTSTTTTTTTFSSTSTTTTTTSTTTTTFEATERAVKYTTQDPFARLESWKKKKFQFGSKAKYPLVPSYQGDLLTAEDIDETDSAQQPSTEATYNFAQHFRNRQRPWGKNGGRRLRRKKPSRGVYVKKHTSDTLGLFGGIEPTRRPYKPRTRVNSYTTSTKSTTETTEAVDQAAKKKYRPFFDEIYSRLTTEKAETTADTSRRYGLPRRGSRSTTAAPLFTADLLEVYEVDPETGLRVTTRSPTTKTHDLHFSRTTTQLKSIEPVDTDTDYYTYQDDYVYEPTTSQAPVTKEEVEVTMEEVQEYVPTVQTSVKTVVTENVVTEEPSTVAVEVTEEEIHETADKHSTTTLPSVIETTFSYDDNEVDVDRIDLDIHNEISDQLVEESQRIETTWNGVVKVEDHTQSNTRLSSYEKNVDTSIYGADTEYNVSGLEPQVNEHSKPTATGAEAGDHENGDSWQTSVTQPKVREYLEIDRSEPIARVEEVPITESRDYSEPDIIYDVTKDGFDDDVDTFSVPVAVAFNVPETEPPVVIQTSTVSQEVTTSDVIETETSTVPVIETTTLRETVPTTTVEEAQSSTTTTVEEQSTTTFAEEATTTVSPTTEKPESTFNKFYNLIHRNRNNRLEQVYLGSRPTTTLRTTTPTAPTTQIIDLTKSAHKVPNSVWSHFERSREDRTTTKAPVIVVEEEENTTTMSYNNTNSNTHVVADLPKPSEHESEVLVEKQVVSTEETGYSGFVPRRKTNKEKWRKSLLASKKKYNKPKFPRVPLLPFAPSHQKSQYHPETTSQTVTTKEDNTEDRNEIVEEVAREPTLFAPTMPPKEDNKEESNNRPLLDNIYSSTSRRKVSSSRFQKPEIPSTTESKTPRVFGVPRGSRTDLFRSYGTSSLSQADFERQILGVSTATEISVKSMICVKGRCYNADESGRLKQN